MLKENLNIQMILVPAGAEHRAVEKGLSQVPNAPRLIAIPAGPQGVKKFLDEQARPLQDSTQASGILLMGLGGSLSAKYGVGDAVVTGQIWRGFGPEEIFECDRTLTTQIAQRLGIAVGVGVTCDRVITTVKEKQRLGDRYSADVVDMEAAVLLKEWLVKELPGAIAVLRVISDDCHYDLPDISGAISPDGSLKPLLIATRFLRQPAAAMRLIRASLNGLKALENLTTALFE